MAARSLWFGKFSAVICLVMTSLTGAQDLTTGYDHGQEDIGRNTTHHTVSAHCQHDYGTYQAAAVYGIPWATKMWDAQGTAEAGLWSGNSVWEGRASQCNSVYAGFIGADGKPFRGRHCSTVWTATLSGFQVKFGFGICVPGSCSSDDVFGLMQDHIVPSMRMPADVEYPDIPDEVSSHCEPNHGEISDPGAIVALVIVSLFLALAVAGTLYDVISRKRRNITGSKCPDRQETRKSEREDTELQTVDVSGNLAEHPDEGSRDIERVARSSHQTKHQANACSGNTDDCLHKPNTCEELLLAFSVYQNAPRMLSFDHARGSYQCLNGIRFLSMAWIVLGHTWQLGITLTGSPTVENTSDLHFVLMKRGLFNLINNSNIAVESFFILSAMLTTVSLLKQLKRCDKKPTCTMFGLYYFHRYWRLTPVYMLILMMWTVFFPYLRTGPLWPLNVAGSANCRHSWWKHLLYVNNLVDLRPQTECMGWTWYLANDFQFYLIAPAFICLLFWVPVAGYVVTSLAILGSVIAMAVLQHGVYVRGDTSWYYDIYVKPWTRSGTYFIGIFLGYLVYRTDCKIRINKLGVVAAWLASLVAISAAVYASWDVASPGAAQSAWVAFTTLQRPFFALGVFWIILACCSGYGGVINWILSWRGWLPLARLTYTGYLIHPMIIYYTYYSSPAQIIVTDWIMTYYFLGTLVLTLGISFTVSLILEIPFSALEKVMFKNIKK